MGQNQKGSKNGSHFLKHYSEISEFWFKSSLQRVTLFLTHFNLTHVATTEDFLELFLE